LEGTDDKRYILIELLYRKLSLLYLMK